MNTSERADISATSPPAPPPAPVQVAPVPRANEAECQPERLCFRGFFLGSGT